MLTPQDKLERMRDACERACVPCVENVIIETQDSVTLWYLTLHKYGEITLKSDEVLDQKTFIKKCFAKFHYPFKPDDTENWRYRVQGWARDAVILDLEHKHQI